ncbi:thioester reductase domain-containing protein [Novipirellula sp. SH528]|uniref:thioester reductase domain-containing protein n=1 Tax=Novipirellula sp. SH528 TaxID=3454466 RepID=UPI003FA1345D
MTERNQPTQREPLALVGVGCRFPGGVRDTDSLWQLLVDGRSAIREVPDDRWHVDRYHHRDPDAIAHMVTRRGGFVDQLKQFDPAFWGISPREAMRMDPQQRWLLETAWEACEDAGIAPSTLRGTSVGVFVGAASHDYGTLQLNDLANLDVHTNTGGTLSIAANRISYMFDFKGPSLAVDTACSSALVAVALACRAIWSGECDAALAGGVNALITPNTSIGFSKASMLSPSGECYAFDARANGYVRGEGAGLVLLKPLSQAIQQNDRIYAVLRSAVVNQDGQTSSMTVPSVAGQSEMLSAAYREAGVAPQDVAYMEAHGTGTPVGDPIEAEALGRVLSQGRADDDVCYMGSIKTNIGHLECASGVAGLVKAALVLDRKQIPANRNYETPNASIPLDRYRLQVPTELRSLRSLNDQPPIAAVNSFGFGGTNAHVVLQAAPDREHSHGDRVSAERPFVLPISARDESALREYAERYRQRLKTIDGDLADFCYSAAARKEHYNHRLTVIGKNPQELRQRLAQWLEHGETSEGIVPAHSATLSTARSDANVFVFTGQGSQWCGMGQSLIKREPIVRETLEEIDGLFQSLAGWSLLREMELPDRESNIQQTRVAQPAIFAIQVALVRLWASWGIRPASVVGHSVGEVAAAWYAGIYSLPDAVSLIYHRSRLQNETGGAGRMLVAGVSAIEANEFIGSDADRVQVTAENSPSLVTIGGDTEPLEAIGARLEKNGNFVRWLGLDYAFHTHQMDPIQNDLLEALANLDPQPETIPFVSTVTGQQYSGKQMDAGYWWRNVREPVRFESAMATLAADGAARFLEIGPHPSLRGSIDACLVDQKVDATIVHSLTRKSDAALELATNLAKLAFDGVDVDWCAVNQSSGKFVPQPHYPWNYQEYWLDQGDTAHRIDPPLHPFLGQRLDVAQPTWQFHLDPHLFPYLHDHQIWNGIVFPAAGYAEIGMAIAAELFPNDSYAIEDLECISALFVSDTAIPKVQVVFDEKTKSFRVHSTTSTAAWEIHAQGRLVAIPSASESQTIDLQGLRKRLPSKITHDDLYRDLHGLGYGFGGDFSLIDEVWSDAEGADAGTSGQESLSRIIVAGRVADDTSRYCIHPAVLDACFQATHGTRYVVGQNVSGQIEHNNCMYLPESIGRVQRHAQEIPAELWAHATCSRVDGTSVEYSIRVVDDSGKPVASISRFRVARVDSLHNGVHFKDHLYQFGWQPQELSRTLASDVAVDDRSSPAPSLVFVFVDENGVGESVAAKFQQRGDRVISLRRGSAFERTNENEFRLTDGTASEIERVFAEAGLGDSKLAKIVHCWTLDHKAKIVHDEQLLAEQRSGVFSALQLSHALNGTNLATNPRVYFVTRSATSIHESDPLTGLAASPLTGFCRVANNESNQFQWTLVDLESKPSDSEIDDLVDEIASDNDEREVALREDQRFVNRLQRVTLDQIPQRRSKAVLKNGQTAAFKLQMTKAGVLEQLTLNETHRRSPGPDEIEIRVRAGGINFRDVMKALGMYPGTTEDLLWFGDDFSGIVVATGANVNDIQCGDCVSGIAPYAFRSHITVDHRLAFKHPTNLSFEQATTLPTVFMTTHFAIKHVARMQQGEKILIHAAAGGIGQAAIQVAQHLGLEIFATAGSDEKRDMLKAMGVRHVMNSRTVQFADQIIDLTAGEGVDAVLNSLAGEFVPKSLSVLAPLGRFLEIGKIDVYENSKLGLAAFKNNISYHMIDLAQIIAQKPGRIASILAELSSLFDSGTYRPLPHKVFPIEEAVDAFRYMAQGQHTGKNVLSFPADQTAASALSIGPCTEDGQLLRADASYLITGGAGGFGWEIAKWMIRQGARHVVLISRSGPSEDAAIEIESLRAEGVTIQDVRGDATKREDVERVIKQIHAESPALKGVVHAAMVLDDAFIADLNEERFAKVLYPKMLGAWNLHHFTRDIALDHFICFSSFSNVVGATKQANYNAGNSFLDALAHHRRASGLPALTLNWGALLDAGFVARNNKTAEYLDGVGLKAFRISEALDVFAEMILRDTALVGAGRVDWKQLSKVSDAVATLPMYESVRQDMTPNPSNSGLQSQLRSASQHERLEILCDFVASQVAGVFGIESANVDRETSLAQVGIDSLMAVELINRIETAAGTRIPMNRILRGPSVRELSHVILELMSEFDESEKDTPSKPAIEESALVGDRIDFHREAQLDPSIIPSGIEVDVDSSPRVLLTGATGFLGAHLLHELLGTTTSQVVCMVRAENEIAGKRRIAENLFKYGLQHEYLDDRVRVLISDFSQPRLGLSEEHFDRLADSVDVIYHNGANVNLLLPYQSLKSDNVDGTRELLRLACRGKQKPMHYVSTFTVHATEANRGRTITESDALPRCEDLLYGYSQTKWVTERMLEEARRRGLPVTIYRPGHVTGHSETGIANVDDLLHQIVRACLLVGAAPFRDFELDVTPVDFVSKAIVYLAQQKQNRGNIFHLTNPHPLTADALADWMRDGGANVQWIDIEPWRERLADLAKQTDESAEGLNVLADIMMPRLATPDNRGIHGRFDCQQTLDALLESGIQCAAADARLISICHGYLQKTSKLQRINAPQINAPRIDGSSDSKSHNPRLNTLIQAGNEKVH